MSEMTVAQKPIELLRGEQAAQVALTLRDYFAAQVLSRMVYERDFDMAAAARGAYAAADAMLVERAR